MNLPANRSVAAPGTPPGSPVLYMLHGFLGSGRNWASFARRLTDRRPDWVAQLIDLRLHGDSRDVSGPHSVHAAAEDVARFHAAEGGQGIPCAVLGHSFGGKVALELTPLLQPDLRQTWVIDSTPSPSSGSSSSGPMLEVLDSSPAEFANRNEAVRHVMQGGFDEATGRWMATNLRRHGETWQWDLDRVGLAELLADFASRDLWPLLEALPAEADVHFVRASGASILSVADAERIAVIARQGMPVALHELDGGHWLHMDNPDGLLDLVAPRLPRLPRLPQSA